MLALSNSRGFGAASVSDRKVRQQDAAMAKTADASGLSRSLPAIAQAIAQEAAMNDAAAMVEPGPGNVVSQVLADTQKSDRTIWIVLGGLAAVVAGALVYRRMKRRR